MESPSKILIENVAKRIEIIEWFSGIVYPDISLNENHEICIASSVSVQIGKSSHLVHLLNQPTHFKALDPAVQISILDILFIILKRSPYNVVRFQNFSYPQAPTRATPSLTRTFINLLDKVTTVEGSNEIALRVIRLIGLAAATGISSRDIRTIFSLLDSPTPLTLSLLQSVRSALKQETSIGSVKAMPPYFFNFGGFGSGLYSVLSSPCFTSEYQMMTWFRVDQFSPSPNDALSRTISLSYDEGDASATDKRTARSASRSIYSEDSTSDEFMFSSSILSIVSPDFLLEVSLDGRFIVFSISDCKSEVTRIALKNYPEDGQGVRRGQWYHINVKHTKPKFPYIGSEELTILVDQVIVFQKSIKMPAFLPTSRTEIVVGKNFNGQIAPIYLFSEPVPPQVADFIALSDAGKCKASDYILHGANPLFPDLVNEIVTPDRKTHHIYGKVAVCYHPARCAYGHALDVHADKLKVARAERQARHARLGRNTFPSHFVDVRDVLETVGGIDAILSLFPRLLISTNLDTYANTSGGLSVAKPPTASKWTGDSVERYIEANLPSSAGEGSGKTSGNLRGSRSSNPSPLRPIRRNSAPYTKDTSARRGSNSVQFELSPRVSDLFTQSRDLGLISKLNLADLEEPDHAKEGCLALLFSIVTLCLTDRKKVQKYCVDKEFVEMIAYVLMKASSQIYAFENEKPCVLALLRLQSTVTDFPMFEEVITKRLICNFKIWSKSNFEFQSSLLSIIYADVKVRPDYYVRVIGVNEFLDILQQFYIDTVEQTQFTPPKRRTSKISPTASNAPASSSVAAGSSIISPGHSFTLSPDNYSSAKPIDAPTADVITASSNNANKSVSQKKGLSPLNIEIPVPDESPVIQALLESPDGDGSGDASPAPRQKLSKSASVSGNVATSDTIVSILATESVAAESDGPEPWKAGLPYFTMTRKQRQRLRSGLQTIVITMIQKSSNGHQEVKKLMSFIMFCKDPMIIDELLQMLLGLIVDCGEKIVSAVTECCGGVDEFATYILHTFVTSDEEEVRCGGVRLLTHYFLRLSLIPSSLSSLSLRNAKNNLLSRTMDKFTASMSEEQEYMQRMLVCGGFTLLCEFLNRNIGSASALTYSVLLEMLLIKPGSKSNISLQSLFEVADMALMQSISAGNGDNALSGRNMSPQVNRYSSTGGGSSFNNSTTTDPDYVKMSPRIQTKFGPRQVDFALQYLQPYEGLRSLNFFGNSTGNDSPLAAGIAGAFHASPRASTPTAPQNGPDITNPLVLSVFCYLIPNLPFSVLNQVCGDFYTLVKYSSGNRDTFCTTSVWNCLFTLIRQSIEPDDRRFGLTKVSSVDVMTALQHWSPANSGSSQFRQSAGRRSGTRSLAASNIAEISSMGLLQFRGHRRRSKCIKTWKSFYDNAVAEALGVSPDDLGSSGTVNSVSDPDVCYYLTLKSFSDLLQHAIQYEHGWCEILRAISLPVASDPLSSRVFPSFMPSSSLSASDSAQSEMDPNEITNSCIAQSVLCHLVYDMCVSMKSTYSELKLHAKSSNAKKKKEAVTKLENILACISISTMKVLENQSILTSGIPDYRIGIMRCQAEAHHRKEKYNHSLTGEVQWTNEDEDAQEKLLIRELAQIMDAEGATGGVNSPDSGSFSARTKDLVYWLDLSFVWHTLYDSNDSQSSSLPTGVWTQQPTPAATSTAPIDIAPDVAASLTSNDDITTAPGPVGTNIPVPPLSIPPIQLHSLRVPSEMDGLSEPRYSPKSVSGSPKDSKLTPSAPPSIPKSKLKSTRSRHRGRHPLMFFGEKLEPNDKGCGIEDGKLTLALETLQLFDSLFWSTDSLTLKNAQILKYTNRSPTMLIQSSGTASGVLKPDPEHPPLVMPIYFHVFRLSLYALNSLSPMNSLSYLNVFRIRALLRPMSSQSLLPPQLVPVPQLLVASLAHMTIQMQRLAYALSFIYSKLGLANAEIVIKIAGSMTEEETFQQLKQKALEEDFFFHLDGDRDRKNELLTMFDSAPGRNVIRYLKASFGYFVDIIDNQWTQSYLKSVLDKSTFRALGLFAQSIVALRGSADVVDAPIETVQSKDSTAVSGADSDSLAFSSSRDASHSESLSELRSPPSADNQSPSAAQIASAGVASSARARSGSNLTEATEDLDLMMSEMSYLTSELNQSSTLPDKQLARMLEKNHGSFTSATPTVPSADNVDDQDEDSQVFQHVDEAGQSDNSSDVSDQSDTSSVVEQPTSDTHGKPPVSPADKALPKATPMEKDEFKYMSLVSVLKLLRDTYILSANLMRRTDIVKSLNNLEMMEMECSHTFALDLEVMRQGQEQSLNPQMKFANEASSLQDLSILVMSNFTSKEKTRTSNIKLAEQIRSRQMTLKWKQLFRTFDSDRSPWYVNDDLYNQDIPGVSRYELSRKCDNQLTRMITVRTDDPRDHREESYFENLQKVNYEYMESGKNTPAVPGANLPSPVPGAAKSSTKSRIRDFSMAVSNSQALLLSSNYLQESWLNKKSWDETNDSDDDDDNDESAVNKDSALNVEASNAVSENESQKPFWLSLYPNNEDEKLIYFDEVTQITLEYRVLGDIVLTNKYIYFHPREQVGGHGHMLAFESLWPDRRWPIDRLSQIFSRRFFFQNCAIELFFVDSSEVLFAFNSATKLQRFLSRVRKQNIPLLSSLVSTMNPRQAFAKSPWTELWRRRLISNYEYLMRINIAAGRSFNDMSQYPVFPWVISDYTSSVLDLSNPITFRDLTKPIGALDESRLEYFMERYQSFDSDSPSGVPFLYGSHYSTEAFVVYYLIRQEPFTSMAVKLQGGRFDCPDRLFFDLKRTWDGCSKLSLSDVKELVPEFFCCPEIFMNSAQLPLGELQEGGSVSDVVMPPWCTDVFDYIRQHKEALESDYVSDHISDWIDLIFGYKQRGQAAVEAKNIFHYLTYEDAIDIEKIEDEHQKEAVKAQATHYGQTPSQLFTKPHPKRFPRQECLSQLFSRHDDDYLSNFIIKTPKHQMSSQRRHGPVISVQCSSDKLVLMNADFSVCMYKWSSAADPEQNYPFTIRPEKGKVHPSAELGRSRDVIQRQDFIPLVTALPYNPQVSVFKDMPKRRQVILYSSQGLDPSVATGNSAPSSRRNSFGSNQPPSTSLDEERASRSNSLSSGGALASPISSKVVPSNPGSPSTASVTSTATATTITTNATGKDRKASSMLYDLFSLGGSKTKDKGGATPQTTAANSNKRTPLQVEITTEKLSPQHELIQTIRAAVLHEELAVHANSVNYNPFTALPLPLFCNRNVALVVGEGGFGRIVTCGFWDNSIRVHSVDQLREVAINTQTNSSAFTCIQYGSPRGCTFVSGSSDGLCRVWILEKPELANAFTAQSESSTTNTSTAQQIQAQLLGQTASMTDDNTLLVCAHVLWGHFSPVTAISYNSDLELVLSGSASGTLCVHSAKSGAFVRFIDFLRGKSIDVLLLTNAGYIVAHSWDDKMLHLFWVNGNHIASANVSERIQSMAVNGSSCVLVCGTVNGHVDIHSLWNLCLLMTHDISHRGSISYLGFSVDGQYLLIGSDDGSFSVGLDMSANRTIHHPMGQS